MPRDYIMAVGGTGARCLESVIFLSAAGLFSKPLQVLIVDPDQNNGNSIRAGNLVPLYHKLNGFTQPSNPSQRGLLPFNRKPLQRPVLFQAQINVDGAALDIPVNAFWQDPNNPDRTFGKSIDYGKLSSQFKEFLQLFYEQDDLNMELGKGYRGRPNVGVVTLISDLRRTVNSGGNGLQKLTESLRAELKGDPVRVFMFGSVFGGTGAAGLPTLPELLREIYQQEDLYKKLRFGCAMLTPYFTFPPPTAQSYGGPSPDSAIHQVATQAALLHYSYAPPNYQHVYVVGAPELINSKVGHKLGGEEQRNDAHYAELVAALGARDFFSLSDISQTERQLHYTDGTVLGWETLPTLPSVQADRLGIKRKLIALTTFAYLYCNILHKDLKDEKWYSNQAWYVDNFVKRKLTLEDQGQNLDTLYEFLNSYLEWLDMIGQPVKADDPKLFNWDALTVKGTDAQNHLGKLARQESGELPRYADNCYGKIMECLSYLKPNFSERVHPMGLLIYLLYEATSEITVENYRLG